MLDRLRLWEAAPLATTPNILENAITQALSIVGIGIVGYFILEGLGQSLAAKMIIAVTVAGCVSAIATAIKG